MLSHMIKSVNARHILIIVLLVAFVAGSCVGVAPLTRKEANLYEHRVFFSQPWEVQHEKYKTLPIEEQFDIYITSMTWEEPPDAEFAEDIAFRRAKAVKFLVEKLSQRNYPDYGTSDEMTENVKEKIIFIFRVMARNNYHNFKKDAGTVQLIRTQIENMTIPRYRQISEQYLWEITESK